MSSIDPSSGLQLISLLLHCDPDALHDGVVETHTRSSETESWAALSSHSERIAAILTDAPEEPEIKGDSHPATRVLRQGRHGSLELHRRPAALDSPKRAPASGQGSACSEPSPFARLLRWEQYPDHPEHHVEQAIFIHDNGPGHLQPVRRGINFDKWLCNDGLGHQFVTASLAQRSITSFGWRT
ncbi:unnamed protein product [Clonostachys solani]|uniref:Uncharacterized protein n=1 Tax=Clonostachys solani TaxID=160281 RepID=A0A9N9ZBG9_9HYPO|nr:unnamed protein product [Clonostachys solani]